MINLLLQRLICRRVNERENAEPTLLARQ